MKHRKNSKNIFFKTIYFKLDTQGQHWIRVEMQPDVAMYRLQMRVGPYNSDLMPALIVVLGGENPSSLEGTMLRERMFDNRPR